MLCYAFKVLRQRNYQDIATEDFAHVQDMLAEILSRGISQQIKQGLYRDYTSIEEQTKKLRGKINLVISSSSFQRDMDVHRANSGKVGRIGIETVRYRVFSLPCFRYNDSKK